MALWVVVVCVAALMAYGTSEKGTASIASAERLFGVAFEAAKEMEVKDWVFWGSLTVASSILFVQIVKFLFAPFIRVQHLETIGYINTDNRNPLALSNDVRKRRNRGELPPPFPNGWFCLALSRDIPKCGVKNVEALGNHFAVFRGEDGKAHILDAYCPHLGANLACGGKVTGNALQCPFHGWEFNGEDGKCVRIAYTTDIPANAKTKAWHTLEVNGQILVWFDAEGREPLWYPMSIPEIANGKWTSRGYTQHTVNAHIQEIPENGADVPHLNFLHSPIIMSGNDLRDTQTGKGPAMGWVQHTWEASWAPEKTEGMEHVAVLLLKHGIKVFGVEITPLALNVKAFQVGPALVYLTFDSVFGRGAFVQSLLPVGPLEQVVCHEIWAEWRLPTVIAKFFLSGEAMQVERDIMVWNNKRFNNKPMLTKHEGLILKFRRWFGTFYSESSREVAERTVNPLDW